MRPEISRDLIVLSDIVDVSIALLEKLETILNNQLLFQMLLYKRRLFKSFRGCSKASKKRTMLDVTVYMEWFRDKAISGKGFIYKYE